MKITATEYKNVFAIKAETNGYVALILPFEGGKIASFIRKTDGREFLVQNPAATFLHLGEDDDYEKRECAGFDDMFPTIDEVVIEKQGKKVLYKDHGEICRKSFEYQIGSDGFTLFFKDERLQYSYEKIFSEGENGELIVNYKITNDASEDLNVLWAGHCLVDISDGGKIILPFENGEEVDIVSDFTGYTGARHKRTALKEDFLCVPQKSNRVCYKMYFPKRVARNSMKVRYSDGSEFCVDSDEGLPYIGVWVNDGYFKNMRCIGLEPCTLGYDTVCKAAEYGQTNFVGPQKTRQFTLKLYIQ